MLVTVLQKYFNLPSSTNLSIIKNLGRYLRKNETLLDNSKSYQRILNHFLFDRLSCGLLFRLTHFDVLHRAEKTSLRISYFLFF
jgi:hypothetical protein